MTRLTFEPGTDYRPVWSPDGSAIVYSGEEGIFRKASSGAGQPERLMQGRGIVNDLSRDGRLLLFERSGRNTGMDVSVLPLEGDRKPEPFLESRFVEMASRFSPDGRWVAYASDESGKREVYVQGFTRGKPASGVRWQISSGGALHPAWRGDGKELFYLTLEGKLMAVTVAAAGTAFRYGTPVALFDTRIASPNSRWEYDVTADGQRFLLVEPARQTESRPLTMVINWQAGLKR